MTSKQNKSDIRHLSFLEGNNKRKREQSWEGTFLEAYHGLRGTLTPQSVQWKKKMPGWLVKCARNHNSWGDLKVLEKGKIEECLKEKE